VKPRLYLVNYPARLCRYDFSRILVLFSEHQAPPHENMTTLSSASIQWSNRTGIINLIANACVIASSRHQRAMSVP
jgi:hypothetical protein